MISVILTCFNLEIIDASASSLALMCCTYGREVHNKYLLHADQGQRCLQCYDNSYQSLGEHLAVELLEHILVLDVLEHHHHLKIGFEIPDSTNLWVRIVT